MSDPDPVEALRAQIDAVDESILDLVGRRAAFVEALAAAKGLGPGALALRPAREVRLLRRLLEKAPGNVDPDTVIEVWRGLMAGALRRQQNIEVVAAGAGEAGRIFDLARRHFGQAARIVRGEDPRAALSRVIAEPGCLAVLPWPGNTGPGGWWPIMSERRYHGLALIAALPMRADGAEPEGALVAAGATLEPAGGDHTLVLAFDPHHRVVRALNTAALPGREVGRAREAVLLRIDEFVVQTDPRMVALASEGLDALRVVGVYAQI